MSSLASTSATAVEPSSTVNSQPATSMAPHCDLSSASSLKLLKGSMHLDLSSSSSSRKQNITAELLSLIKASPGIFTQATTTPTPTKVLYPTDVTIAQRQYAQGFLDALASVQKLNGFVPAPGLLNSPSFLTPLLPSVTTTCDPSKTVSSPILTSPTREPLSVIMQAMSGMGGFAGYGLPQLYNPMSQAPPPPQQMMVPSTSSLPVSTITSCLPPQPLPPQPTSQHQVVVPRSVKNEMASSVSDESKESSYDMYNPAESTNDGEACSSTRSNGSPMSQDELGMSSFSGFSEYNLSDQERKKLERKRARNRTAATKCRQRKLMKISELERVVNEEKQTGTRLSHELKMLEASIAQLRQTLHEHRNRGCVIPTK